MKPSWEDAPEWAQWLAMDEDGEWYCYEERPCIGRSGAEWDAPGRFVGCFLDPDGWRDTLEHRPAQPAPEMPSLDELIEVADHAYLYAWRSLPIEKCKEVRAARAKLQAVKEAQ